MYFIPRTNEPLILSFSVLPTGYAVLYYMLDTQMFIHYQSLPHSEHRVCIVSHRNHGVSPLATRTKKYFKRDLNVIVIVLRKRRIGHVENREEMQSVPFVLQIIV